MIIRLYGIPNCDSVRKARKWLAQHAVDYQFIDLRDPPIDTATLAQWLKQVDWQTLVNRRSSTWRQLDTEVQAQLNNTTAASLLHHHPTLIKRPVLQTESALVVGFNASHYQELFR